MKKTCGTKMSGKGTGMKMGKSYGKPAKDKAMMKKPAARRK